MNANALLHDSTSIPSLSTLARAADAAQAEEDTPRWESVLTWMAQITLAWMLFSGGAAMFLNDLGMMETFSNIGYGQGIRSVVAAVELGAGLALLLPATAIIGALVASPTLLAAIGVHVFLLGDSPAVAAVLLVLAVAIAWIRRPR